MSTGAFPPPVPLDGDDADEAVTRDEDGEEVLDEDADPDRVDSAEADRLATGADGD